MLSSRKLCAYLLAETLLEMLIVCTLLIIFYENQRQFTMYEKKEYSVLKDSQKTLNISKKLLLVGQGGLSSDEKSLLDVYSKTQFRESEQ
ncbi:hypothetical protein [Liquorilactobacillus satsumensis]|uniref:hypothetical protein n=1 Tax=Liquorilactobacillus satsumensis TaxID=259059 RepID=UPI0039E72CDD